LTGTPLDLLGLVGVGARLLGIGRGGQANGQTDSVEFAKALDAAGKGELETGRVVVSGPELGMDLSAEQLERLSHAADVAEAQGASTAAVLLDGVVIKLDVESRTATESMPAESAVMDGVDVVLSAGPSTPAAPSGDVLLRHLAPSGAPMMAAGTRG